MMPQAVGDWLNSYGPRGRLGWQTARIGRAPSLHESNNDRWRRRCIRIHTCIRMQEGSHRVASRYYLKKRGDAGNCIGHCARGSD